MAERPEDAFVGIEPEAVPASMPQAEGAIRILNSLANALKELEQRKLLDALENVKNTVFGVWDQYNEIYNIVEEILVNSIFITKYRNDISTDEKNVEIQKLLDSRTKIGIISGQVTTWRSEVYNILTGNDFMNGLIDALLSIVDHHAENTDSIISRLKNINIATQLFDIHKNEILGIITGTVQTPSGYLDTMNHLIEILNNFSRQLPAIIVSLRDKSTSLLRQTNTIRRTETTKLLENIQSVYGAAGTATNAHRDSIATLLDTIASTFDLAKQTAAQRTIRDKVAFELGAIRDLRNVVVPAEVTDILARLIEIVRDVAATPQQITNILGVLSDLRVALAAHNVADVLGRLQATVALTHEINPVPADVLVQLSELEQAYVDTLRAPVASALEQLETYYKEIAAITATESNRTDIISTLNSIRETYTAIRSIDVAAILQALAATYSELPIAVQRQLLQQQITAAATVAARRRDITQLMDTIVALRTQIDAAVTQEDINRVLSTMANMYSELNAVPLLSAAILDAIHAVRAVAGAQPGERLNMYLQILQQFYATIEAEAPRFTIAEQLQAIYNVKNQLNDLEEELMVGLEPVEAVNRQLGEIAHGNKLAQIATLLGEIGQQFGLAGAEAAHLIVPAPAAPIDPAYIIPILEQLQQTFSEMVTKTFLNRLIAQLEQLQVAFANIHAAEAGAALAAFAAVAAAMPATRLDNVSGILEQLVTTFRHISIPGPPPLPGPPLGPHPTLGTIAEQLDALQHEFEIINNTYRSAIISRILGQIEQTVSVVVAPPPIPVRQHVAHELEQIRNIFTTVSNTQIAELLADIERTTAILMGMRPGLNTIAIALQDLNTTYIQVSALRGLGNVKTRVADALSVINDAYTHFGVDPTDTIAGILEELADIVGGLGPARGSPDKNAIAASLSTILDVYRTLELARINKSIIELQLGFLARLYSRIQFQASPQGKLLAALAVVNSVYNGIIPEVVIGIQEPIRAALGAIQNVYEAASAGAGAVPAVTSRMGVSGLLTQINQLAKPLASATSFYTILGGKVLEFSATPQAERERIDNGFASTGDDIKLLEALGILAPGTGDKRFHAAFAHLKALMPDFFKGLRDKCYSPLALLTSTECATAAYVVRSVLERVHMGLRKRMEAARALGADTATDARAVASAQTLLDSLGP